MNVVRRMRKWEAWVAGWTRIADGLVRVASFGYIKLDLTWEWTIHCLNEEE